jgi:hypothetical protein
MNTGRFQFGYTQQSVPLYRVQYMSGGFLGYKGISHATFKVGPHSLKKLIKRVTNIFF